MVPLFAALVSLPLSALALGPAPAMAATTCPISLPPSVWQPAAASNGWSPMTFTPTGPLSFTLAAQGKPGFGAMTTTVNVNLTQDPYLVVDVVKLSGGAEWAVRGGASGTLITANNSTSTGVQAFNVAKALNLSGQQSVALNIFENTVPGVLTVGFIKMQSSQTGCAASTSAQATTPTSSTSSTGASSTTASGTAASSASASSTSLPKTGEAPWIPVVGVLLAAMGVVFGAIRRRPRPGSGQ